MQRAGTKILTTILAFFIFVGDVSFGCLKFIIKPFTRRPAKRHRQSLVFVSKLKYFAIGVIFSLIFITIPTAFIGLVNSLPNPNLLSVQEVPQTTKIYDRHHTLLYQFYADQNRTIVHLSQVPKYLQEATIAIEDKNFYKNPGFDVVAIIRAALQNAKNHHLQGGSTITQQLIKTQLLTAGQTFKRKLEEIILSFWAERLYSKNQILEMYLNDVAYGGTAWGVDSASQTYFGKDVKDLDLAECAFLAGMPQAPTTYSPFSSRWTSGPGNDQPLWKGRQIDVLSKMLTLGYITKQQEMEARDESLTFQTPETSILAPHFVMYIKDLLVKKYGLPLVEKGGLSVTTTLDLNIQTTAQKIVTTEVAKDGYLNLTNGAAVITNPKNGDILALVGSHDYNDPNGGTVNLATSLRQPGSSIKIVTYTAALSHGYTAASILDDSPITYTSGWGSVYSPVDYDGKWHGPVTLRTAFANSLNIPAVKTLNVIGIPTFVALGRAMGLSSLLDPENYGLSVTLGSADVKMLDMAATYGTIANSGKRVDLNPILLVTDGKGNILEQKGSINGTQVVDQPIAFILSNILADNNARSMEFGTNSPLLIPGKTVSVKTGTTDSKRDNWTIGFNELGSNHQYVVTVWVGNNDNSPMSPNLASGITGAAPIWHEIMASLLQNEKDTPLIPTSNIVIKPCLGHDEYFVKGTENVLCQFAVSPTITPLQPTIIHYVSHGSRNNQIKIEL